jgi:uncharacterized Zn-binding protein involved in type VI secretion
MTLCPLVTPAGEPHSAGVIIRNDEPTVFIDYRAAVRMGEISFCMAGGPAMILGGCPTVFIENRPAAREGDYTAHGGVIAIGSPFVIIGNTAPGVALLAAAAFGAAAAATGGPGSGSHGS